MAGLDLSAAAAAAISAGIINFSRGKKRKKKRKGKTENKGLKMGFRGSFKEVKRKNSLRDLREFEVN